MSTVVSKVVPVKWVKLFKLIPGYDCIATAGDCWFDWKAAEAAIGFIEQCLTHVKGELGGKPFLLEDWEKAIIGCLFGWKRPDGTRRYRESLIYVARKNGKTALCAAIILTVLFMDKEPGAELYSAAADREQAALIYEQAKGMVLQEPELEKRCQIYTTGKSIVRSDVHSSYKAISAEANTKHGYNVHCAIIDELHTQPNRDLVDVLTTAIGARRQPLIISITTADYDRESICNEKHAYACKVRDGVLDNCYFLPVIYEILRDEDWTSPEVWKKANPNMGVSVSVEYLTAACKKAQEEPSYENTFKRLHLNMKTTSDVVWLPMDKWDLCNHGPIDIDMLASRECYCGLDLATTTDIAAFGAVFPPVDEGEPWHALLRFWIPEDNARQRERRDKVPYITWARNEATGLKMTSGNVIDYDVIRKDIDEFGRIFNIRKIGVDRWNASQIMTQLQGDGFEIEKFGQGFQSMSSPTKELERLVMSGQFSHGGNPILRWMNGNTFVEHDAAGNIKPSKAKSVEKIDGMVAVIMGLGVSATRAPAFVSIYETKGNLSL